ncbi:MAG: MaoC family dehydratase [Deltaproteobacteria bacterium]|nr:MaoC family dehydratase [Deltaproteobacteria bacterium]
MAIIGPEIGPYWEDFNVGDIIKHWPGRTITEADNIWFTLLTLNTHPIHFDENYAKDQMFGKTLVNSTFTLALVAGMTVRLTSQNTIANLGWSDIKLPNPVFVGDTIYAETEIVSKRESRSRPDAGIVSFKQTGYNQKNEVVVVYTRTSLAKRRGYDEGKLPQFGTLE